MDSNNQQVSSSEPALQLLPAQNLQQQTVTVQAAAFDHQSQQNDCPPQAQPTPPDSVVPTRYSQYRRPYPGEPLPVPMKGDEGLLGISLIYMLLSLLITPFLAIPLAWLKVNLPKRRAAAIIGTGLGTLIIYIALYVVDILGLYKSCVWNYIWVKAIIVLSMGAYLLRTRKMLEKNEMIRQQSSATLSA
jgi:hypothetical protein